ncbi:MEMO1 family [Trichoderma ceciliae]
MDTRPASKAGQWYEQIPIDLAKDIKKHAGYSYSGETAAWAYSCLDLSKAKRVFILGPSHTYGFSGCAVTTFSKYGTPFGDFTVDRDTIERVKEAGGMKDMPPSSDVAEHSLELHLPLLYKRCEQTFKSPDDFPKVVPLIVGSTSRADEKDIGRLLLSYLKDEENAFIISSDFCHWGTRFDYAVYTPDGDLGSLVTLHDHSPKPAGPPIYETIRLVDEAAMEAVKSGSHDAFFDNMKHTGNTVCGRHPIGIAMAALELYAKELSDENKSRFRVVKYDRSSEVVLPDDSSVSYVSAYAVL